ncbi:hypothetical protein MRB53_029918 [Persea americana]|uniref:Uncharacterized protein n=1 Tax=Persea americana TaxID=3435 RepID=A0ACC2KK92_PERAE|nr:hypothetical protein MRB53_029918 [Persea americana]
MEASKAKSDPVPVVVRSEGAFNAGIILDESNYDVWSQLVEMHIAEREKLSFIRGMPQPPAEKDEGYEQWYAENQKVKRWILMSMKPEIMKRYLRLKTAHEIWIALSKAFYDGSDELQVFALNQKAFKSKQGGRSVSEYYGELVEIFRELDHRDMVTMKDPEDVKSYHDAIERLRVHIFLAGLDETFEQVRGEMLRKDLLPSLEECYAVIRREAVRRETLNTDAGNSDVAVMIMKNKSRASRGSEKPNYKCTKCNKSGHTKERCYEVIGYPDWWDHNRGSQRKDSNGKATTAIITAEAEKGEQNTVLATTTGTLDNNGKALLSSTNTGNNTWIIDSACSDHITFDASKIQNLKSSSQKNITTADGSESSIIGEGTLSITENLNLDTVLVVPDLKYNLLSVSQITKSLSCVVIFWPNFCVFKSIQTRKTIGCGIRRGKLYYLDLASKYSEKLGQAFALEENSDKKKTEELMYFEPVSGIQDENRGDHGIQTLSLDEIQLLRMDDTDKEIRGEAENVTYENVVAEHSEHVASEVRETEPEAPEIEEVTDGEAIGSEVTEGLLDDNPGSLNDIPHQSSNKGTNVSSRVLPARQNRGIPKSSYEPNLTNTINCRLVNNLLD